MDKKIRLVAAALLVVVSVAGCSKPDEPVYHDILTGATTSRHSSSSEPVTGRATPYYIAEGAWECSAPGHLLGDHMHDKTAQCISPDEKPAGLTPTVVVDVWEFDVWTSYAMVCYSAELAIGKGVFCDYVLATSIVDASGNRPDIATLKTYAAKQTMQDVRAVSSFMVVPIRK